MAHDPALPRETPRGSDPLYTFRERVVHAIVAVSFTYLVLTGLALWSPAFYWIATVLGGGFLVRAMHPWVGVVLALAVGVMYVSWRRVMHVTAADRQWRQSMWHYIRNEDDLMPPVDRFNYGQKMLFWTMAVTALMLLVSGVVLWFPHYIPATLNWVRQAAVLLHATAALVGMGALIIHVYMGVMVVPGGVEAIIHGGGRESDAAVRH
jgi:formate dehydrogenase subunit gamma